MYKAEFILENETYKIFWDLVLENGSPNPN